MKMQPVFLMITSLFVTFAHAEMPPQFTVDPENIFGAPVMKNVDMGRFGGKQPGYDLAKIIAMDSGAQENFVHVSCYNTSIVPSKVFKAPDSTVRTHRLVIPAKPPSRVGVEFVAELDPGNNHEFQFQMKYAQRGAVKSIKVPLNYASAKDRPEILETGSPRYASTGVIEVQETAQSKWQTVGLLTLSPEDRKRLRQFILMASSLFLQCGDGKASKAIDLAKFKANLANYKYNHSRPPGTVVPESLPATK